MGAFLVLRGIGGGDDGDADFFFARMAAAVVAAVALGLGRSHWLMHIVLGVAAFAILGAWGGGDEDGWPIRLAVIFLAIIAVGFWVLSLLK